MDLGMFLKCDGGGGVSARAEGLRGRGSGGPRARAQERREAGRDALAEAVRDAGGELLQRGAFGLPEGGEGLREVAPAGCGPCDGTGLLPADKLLNDALSELQHLGHVQALPRPPKAPRRSSHVKARDIAQQVR